MQQARTNLDNQQFHSEPPADNKRPVHQLHSHTGITDKMGQLGMQQDGGEESAFGVDKDGDDDLDAYKRESPQKRSKLLGSAGQSSEKKAVHPPGSLDGEEDVSKPPKYQEDGTEERVGQKRRREP